MIVPEIPTAHLHIEAFAPIVAVLSPREGARPLISKEASTIVEFARRILELQQENELLRKQNEALQWELIHGVEDPFDYPAAPETERAQKAPESIDSTDNLNSARPFDEDDYWAYPKTES